jgi:hypothetical protein
MIRAQLRRRKRLIVKIANSNDLKHAKTESDSSYPVNVPLLTLQIE